MAPKRRRASAEVLETANAKTDDIFVQDYLASAAVSAVPWTTTWTHPHTGKHYSIELQGSQRLRENDLKACLDLIEETSRRDYEGSTTGWHPEHKLDEMRSPDLRYILVKDDSRSLRGFTSLMPTFEEGQPVVYCYEIHLKPELQGTGLGRLLMGFPYTVAVCLPPITKVMLTCFISNERGLKFYEKLGFQKDDITPEPRMLRSRKTWVPDYVILSKAVSRLSLPLANREQTSTMTDTESSAKA